MIAVIADDFTGAAEIGGIGLRYGLSVVIETEVIQDQNADMLIIATDTRSMNAHEASEHIFKITKELMLLQPKFIYKKVDSVLRGNVLAELISQMKASGSNRTILVAANPVFRRIINNGIYYIDDVPLNETFFSTDPEYPVNSSSVLDIVGTGDDIPVYNLKPDDALPDEGLIIGDVTCNEDLGKWALCSKDFTILAGASGFFEAWLVSQNFLPKPENLQHFRFGQKMLYILGSTFPKDSDFLRKLENSGYLVLNMPEEIYYNRNFDTFHFDCWINDIIRGFDEHNKVVASIIHPPSNDPDIAIRIKESIGLLARNVVQRAAINELMVEGGATTSAVLKYLHIKKLFPVQELDTGVIRMAIDGMPDLSLTTKPGSYFWPQSVWSTEQEGSIKNMT